MHENRLIVLTTTAALVGTAVGAGLAALLNGDSRSKSESASRSRKWIAAQSQSLAPIPPAHSHGHAESSRKIRIEAAPYVWPVNSDFSPASTALIIIDMQNDFCSVDGYMSFQGYDVSTMVALIPKLERLLHAFREAGFPVYHTREGHRPDLSTLSNREFHRSKNNPSGLGIGSQGPLGRLLIRGEKGHDIVDPLYPVFGEPVIDKPGRGAFAHTDLELLLRNRGVRNLVIVGVTADVCVSTTMREANDRGFDCVVLGDAVEAVEDSLRESTLESVKMEGGIFGAVSSVEDVLGGIQLYKSSGKQ